MTPHFDLQSGIGNKGLALIELLVVVSALALLMMASVNLLIRTSIGSTRENIASELKQTGDYVLSSLEDSLRFSKELLPVGDPPVICDSNMSELQFVDQSGNTQRWWVDAGRLMRNEDPVTSSSIRVRDSRLYVDCTQPPAQRNQYVSISFALEKTNTASGGQVEEVLATQQFSIGVGLRNR